MILIESKQVGNLSYYVSNINTLVQIIEQGEIWTSKSKEYNSRLKKKMNFVSTSRDMFAAPKRNNNRWKYGIIIDGDGIYFSFYRKITL